MSKNYKVAAVSPKQEHWKSSHGGDMVTYYIRLEGEGDQAVQLNKKAESKPPEEGEDLYGDISSTAHGLKLTVNYGEQNKGSSGSYHKSPEQEESIARAVALKAAVELFAPGNGGDITLSATLNVADQFLAWLKNEKPTAEAPEQPESKEKTRDWENVGKQDKVISFDEGEPVNLDDIPF